MIKKTGTIFFLISWIILLIIVLILLRENNQIKMQNHQLVNNYTQNHKARFSLHLERLNINDIIVGRSHIMKNDIIIVANDIRDSIIDYQVADNILNDASTFNWMYCSLLEDYARALDAYVSASGDDYNVLVDQKLNDIINDLFIIDDWLQSRAVTLHTDQEFFIDVYSKLKSAIKEFSDYASRYSK